MGEATSRVERTAGEEPRAEREAVQSDGRGWKTSAPIHTVVVELYSTDWYLSVFSAKEISWPTWLLMKFLLVQVGVADIHRLG